MTFTTDLNTLLGQLTTAIDQINEILIGSETDTVTIGGVVKPSISKAIEDQFDSFNRVAYATRAELYADLNWDANRLASVTNDPTAAYNGEYIKIGASGTGSWQMASDDRITQIQSDIESSLQTLDAEVDQQFADLGIYPDTALQKNLALAITDALGKLALGIDALGNQIYGRHAVEAGNRIAWGVTDENGQSPFFITEQGYVHIQNLLMALSTAFPFAISDSNGKRIFGVDPTGAVSIGNLVIETASDEIQFAITDANGQAMIVVAADGNATLAQTADAADYPVPAALNHYISYGQSLSVGRDTPAITTTQPYANKTLGNGVYSGNTEWGAGVFPRSTSLIALIEGIIRDYESPCSGCCNAIIEFVRDISPGIDYTAQQRDFIGTSAGYGGMPLISLGRGTEAYQNLINQVSDAMTAAAAAGKTYNVAMISWMQGESDIPYFSGGTEKVVYKQRLKRLVLDLRNDIAGILGERYTWPFISYQLATNTKPYSPAPVYRPDIALALVECAMEEPDWYLACPMYQFDYIDAFHLDALSTRRSGAYFAKTYHKVIYGSGHKPLYPLRGRRQGTLVEIEFCVPYGVLVLDTTLVALADNYGFSAVDDNGAVSITSVALSGPDRVLITLSGTPTGEVTIRYGWGDAPTSGDDFSTWPVGRTAGARGNLRDQEGNIYVFDAGTGNEYALHNYCVIFELEVG